MPSPALTTVEEGPMLNRAVLDTSPFAQHKPVGGSCGAFGNRLPPTGICGNDVRKSNADASSPVQGPSWPKFDGSSPRLRRINGEGRAAALLRSDGNAPPIKLRTSRYPVHG
jgi:hypothetical protein